MATSARAVARRVRGRPVRRRPSGDPLRHRRPDGPRRSGVEPTGRADQLRVRRVHHQRLRRPALPVRSHRAGRARSDRRRVDRHDRPQGRALAGLDRRGHRRVGRRRRRRRCRPVAAGRAVRAGIARRAVPGVRGAAELRVDRPAAAQPAVLLAGSGVRAAGRPRRPRGRARLLLDRPRARTARALLDVGRGHGMADDRCRPNEPAVPVDRRPLRDCRPVAGRGRARVVGVPRHPAAAPALGLGARCATATTAAGEGRRASTTPTCPRRARVPSSSPMAGCGTTSAATSCASTASSAGGRVPTSGCPCCASTPRHPERPALPSSTPSRWSPSSPPCSGRCGC